MPADIFAFEKGSQSDAPPVLVELTKMAQQPQLGQYISATGWIAPPRGLRTPDGVMVLANPDPIITLSEARGLRSYIYDDILIKDGHLGGDWRKLVSAILALDVEVQPGTRDSPEHARRAAGVAEIMNAIPDWYETREELLLSEFVGRAAAEISWRPAEGGPWPWRVELTLLGRDELAFDALGRPWYEPASNGQLFEVPEGKLLLLRRRSTPRNPFGVGLGRGVYFLCWFKREGVIKVWAYYLEKFAFPTVKGIYKAGATPEEIAEFTTNLGSLQQAGVLAHSDRFESELMEAMRSGTVSSYETFGTFLNREISKALFGQTLSSEPSDRGNTATADLHGQMFEAAVRDLARSHSRGITQGLARWIEFYTFGAPPDGRYCEWRVKADPEEDRIQKIELWGRAQRMGAVIGAKQFSEEFGIAIPAADDTPLVPLSGPAASPGTLGFADAVPTLTAREGRIVAERQRVEDAGERAYAAEVDALREILLTEIRRDPP